MPSPPNTDLSNIQLALAEKQSELPQTCKSGISVVLHVPVKQTNTYETETEDKVEVIKKLATGEDPPINKVYKPEFVTLAPPLLSCSDEVNILKTIKCLRRGDNQHFIFKSQLDIVHCVLVCRGRCACF